MDQFILGLPGAVFWLWVSALFYLIAIVFFWVPFRREKNELMSAFFAFLAGMASFHIFLGLGLYLSNLAFVHLGIFAALTGATYTLKFPLTAIRESLRKIVFYAALIVAWFILIWMLIFPHSEQAMYIVTLGYMIIVSGGIAGLFMIWRGLKAKETWTKVKSIGGGLGVMTCCFAADILVLFGGVSMLGEFLMSAAPVLLITMVYIGRYLQKKNESQALPQIILK